MNLYFVLFLHNPKTPKPLNLESIFMFKLIFKYKVSDLIDLKVLPQQSSTCYQRLTHFPSFPFSFYYEDHSLSQDD